METKSPTRRAKIPMTIEVRRSPRISYNANTIGVESGTSLGNSKSREKHPVPQNSRKSDSDDDFVNPPVRIKSSSKGKMGTKVVFHEYNGERIRPRVKASLFHEYIENLTNEQKKIVRQMGFGSMLEITIENIPTGLGRWLVKNYDYESSVLNVGEKKVIITPELVERLLGIPRGKVEIVETMRPRAEDVVIRRWRSQFAEPKAKVCPLRFLEYAKSQTDGGWHFRLNFLVVFCTYMGDITGNNTVNQRFLPSIKDADAVMNLNWCEYMVKMMRRTRKKWKENREYNGSMTLLALAYANEYFGSMVENGKYVTPVKIFTDGDLIKLQDIKEKERLDRGVTLVKRVGNVSRDDKKRKKHESDVDGEDVVKKFTKKDLKKMVIKKCKSGVVAESEETKTELDGYEGVGSQTMGTQTDEEDRAERIADLLQHFDNVYGDICREFEEANDMCSGSLLIKELEKDWEKNLVKYTGKTDEDVKNKDGAPNVEKSTNNSPVRESEFVEEAVGEYQSCQQMTTPKKRKVTFSLPKFNIDSADKTQDFETPMTRSKGKEVQNVTPESPINKLVLFEERPRRFRFLSEAFCSPFAKRAVELKSSITTSESGVAECIFAAFKNHWDVLFSTEHGVSIRRVILETLRPDAWVHVSVMSAWASVLNHEEYIRAKHNSVHRLFCSSVMLHPDHYEKDVKTRISVFSVNMEKMLRMQQLTSIQGVDLVLIPVMYGKHFYVMCFNLKTCHIHMIDNMGTRESFKSRYRGWPEKLRETLAGYLALVGHHGASKMRSSNITRVDVPWKTMYNYVDCGVFAMRHMETFKGVINKDWHLDCGISEEVDKRGRVLPKQKEELNDLRRKYVAKILLTEINKSKCVIVNDVMEYEKMPAAEQEKMQKTAAMRMLERLKLT